MRQAIRGLTTRGSRGATGALPLLPGELLRPEPLKFLSMVKPSVSVAMARQYLQEFGRFKKPAITGSRPRTDAQYQHAGNRVSSSYRQS